MLLQTRAGEDTTGSASNANAAATGQRYRYAAGTNRLIAITQATGSSQNSTAPKANMQKVAISAAQALEEARQIMRSAWLYHSTGVPLAQFDFTGHDIINASHGTTTNASDVAASGSRRVVYNTAKRPVAVYDANDQLMARYVYNGQGERIAKTVYATRGNDQGRTIYSLYSEQRLAAETDSEGSITAHYVYLNGKPVAKIEMARNTAFTHRVWKILTTMGGLWPDKDIDASDNIASAYAIHTDHLGTPQAVTDAKQQIVWQAETSAFGLAKVIFAAHVSTGGSANNGADSNANGGNMFEMNLRLPGQMFDAETGLNQNYYRDYDPTLGRYTTPDPMGLAGGMNPYVYVSNNPLTNVDPLGLYELDVHYYMTYFLAMEAGIDPSIALKIALAAQYVDDNPNTSPTPEGVSVASLKTNKAALLDYHFVLSNFNPDSSSFGKTISGYNNDDVYLPSRTLSPQLERLKCASTSAPNQNAATQFFGEFLHAFEDTFSHRDSNNVPVDALSLTLGLGHTSYGHNPDYTYNHSSLIPLPGHLDWNFNEFRTAAMESETFAQLKAYAAKIGTASKVEFVDISDVMDNFNAYHEDESNTGKDGLFSAASNDARVPDKPGTSSTNATSKKLIELNTQLAKDGFAAIPYYDVNAACQNRNTVVSTLTKTADAYKAQGVIIDTPTDCPTTNRPGGDYTAPTLSTP